MVKDNPIPLILPLQCLGQKPEIQIVEGDTLNFDRLLLNQSMQKQIRIKNVSAIPIKWKLRDYEQLSEEFSVQNTFGELKPLQETLILVNFQALKQAKFQH